ncbi:4-(cytidine 5'-diphospho)-2-C-methyl-D-erythritol kinase [Anaerosacchariphilus polymeriproducens]|uniref:4-diphosphocytidyl-2-C-methyl-D-erythritol kinase n=1 Tax=Anaerosacchariphilus polymeriproducens TaxID=1812858 RepID=A0A371AV77_9FIRM|nr:4-(cytidine 5'-diphospho)-2-C-methyl-D-erythritol kinase [Anaerosacchariphilus polymeriproducens]RDU23451.1 4-(cytidine 5'-diphospho)-2-C-methyl-D-erythritol kinase [Anaerosacchariphilus polymeriproducens]
MKKLNLKALAKINLGLDVVGKREDGYHEVRMVMQTIHLFDSVEIIVLENPVIKVDTNLYYLPSNENNLVYKAAKLLIDEFKISKGVYINLKKFIPVAAGMAGGSSDAAAVLFGINKLFNLGLSLEELKKRGVKIGADVPYCLMRGTALAEGIGEELTPLHPMKKCPVLIAKPAISVSTKFVYDNLKLNEKTVHPDIDGLIKEIEKGNLRGIAKKMGNVLESVTIPVHPEIELIKNEMKDKGALNAMMSGSGPTVFGLFDSQTKVKEAYEYFRRKNIADKVYLTSIFNV